MGLFENFPYTNFHELNLDWILQMLKKIDKTMDEFVAINALKYADPIQWDITSQYEKNTIVIDPQSGTAYISVQPVPVGVALTNTDYWAVVFDLEQFVTEANGNFTLRVEEQTTTTATFNTPINGWVVWGGVLYKALTNITAGDQYIVDSNIKRFTIEDITGYIEDLATTDKSNLVAAINELVSSINNVVNSLGDLNDLTTSDKTSAVNAINELVTSITNVVNSLGDLNDLNTSDKSSAVNAINEVLYDLNNISTIYIDVTKHGLTGDGVTDDSTALQTLLNTISEGTLYFPAGTYLIGNITVPNKPISFIGEPSYTSVLKMKADSISMFVDHQDFTDPSRIYKYFKIDGNGRSSTTVFDFEKVNYRLLSDIWFSYCYDGIKVNASRNFNAKNIRQTGDLHNEFKSDFIGNSLYNWDAVIDGWQVDTNVAPTPHDAWFTLNAMVCSQFNNMITEGRLECIGFDIKGMNEGTFFNNCVLVCPTFGIRTATSGGVQPACVDLNNFSIDQPLGGGLIIDCWWFMVNNFSCVNGNQRNNTDSAVIINNDSKDIFFNNCIFYNMNYASFNIGAAQRVFLSNCSAKDGSIAGGTYTCPTQTTSNPKVINCDFETVNANGLTFNTAFNQFS